MIRPARTEDDDPNLYPPDMLAMTEEEDRQRTLDALAQAEAGYGIPVEEVMAWLDARMTDPNAPCPKARKLR